MSTETDAKMNCICPYCSQKLVIILSKEAQASLQNTMQNASHETVPLKKTIITSWVVVGRFVHHISYFGVCRLFWLDRISIKFGNRAVASQEAS